MEKALNYCFHFIRNASKVWMDLADDYEDRINLQHLIFAKPLTFDGDSFGTPELSLVFAQKKTSPDEKSFLVARKKLLMNLLERVQVHLPEINTWNREIREVLKRQLRPQILEVTY